MTKQWTSKNKKWRVSIAGAQWDTLYPEADGYIEELRSNTSLWFLVHSRRQRTYRVEDLELDLGFTYGIEVPAYVEQKAIELANLAIIDAKKAAGGRPYREPDFGGFGRLHDDVGGMSLRTLRSMREMTLNRLEALETTPRGPSRMESYAMEHAELDRDLAMIDEEIRRRGASPFGAYRESDFGGFAGQFDKIYADPGPGDSVRRYVELVLEEDALGRAEAWHSARGERRPEIARQREQVAGAILNFQRETTSFGPQQRDEALNLLNKIRRGARIEWRRYGEGSVSGFGRPWKRW
jgi:hypothetical protein